MDNADIVALVTHKTVTFKYFHKGGTAKIENLFDARACSCRVSIKYIEGRHHRMDIICIHEFPHREGTSRPSAK